MSLSDTQLRLAGAQLLSAQNVLVVSHIRPDGDAIGSLLGLGLALQGAGKNVQMVISDGIPAGFRFLEGSAQVRTRPQGDFDLVCIVDCSDLPRVGGALNNGDYVPDINIDHHKTNLNFAKINLVDTGAVATAELIARLLRTVNLPMTQPVVSALLTGLITDTIGFRTSNMTPGALRLAADLMEAGGDLPVLYCKALVTRSFEAARFWGTGLSKLEREGRIVWTTLTMADRQAVNYPSHDDADLVNALSTIEGSDIALIFVEQPDGCIKVSWRAQPGFDVSQVALNFGGGGHPAASGAEIVGSLQQVREAVLSATRPLLRL